MYVFDTSALIGAWVRLYPPDRFESLWDRMDELVADGRAVAPEEVLDELRVQDDDLYAWAKERSSDLVVATTRSLLLETRAILADHPHLTKSGTGRGKADPFVIALAATRGWQVVTQEQGGTSAKPRIPYVCSTREVPCMSFLGVIRAENWQF